MDLTAMRFSLRAPLVLHGVPTRFHPVIHFVQRLIRAALISSFVFLGYVVPLSAVFHAAAPLVAFSVRALDLPIATAALLLPQAQRPFSIWYTPEPGWAAASLLFHLELWRFVRVGVPVYALLLSIPAFVRSRLRRAA